jgi:hypothetical protein
MHYTPDGYAKLAKNIISSIDIQREKVVIMKFSSLSLVSAFWGGFHSPVGSDKPDFTSSDYNRKKSRLGH